MRFKLQAIGLLCAASMMLGMSCELFESNIAVLKTDVPELAVYAAAFNVSQSRYRIHAVFEEDLGRVIEGGEDGTTIVVGRFIKSSAYKSKFLALDSLFTDLIVSQNAFYPSLLDQGMIEGRQLFLPVSFNLPLIIFNQTLEESIEDNFMLELPELQKLGAAYNKTTSKGYSAMGFGPRWYPDFMYEVLRLSGARFKEGTPLSWDKTGLESGIKRLKEWTASANGGPLAEDDFLFKYLYLPPHRSVQEGRIAFSSLSSNQFFTIPEERRSALSFRWLALDNSIKVSDTTVFLGLLRKSSGKEAAEAFIKWYFSENTQKDLLEEARKQRSMESSFGLAGGFSALKTVNEKFFPLYYPSLLGRIPPTAHISTTDILPLSWQSIKKDVLEPLLMDATGVNPPKDIHGELEKRLAAWVKRNSSP